MRKPGWLCKVQAHRLRRQVEDADAGDSRTTGLSSAGLTGFIGVYGTPRARHPERAVVLPERESLGIETGRQHRVVRHGACLAEPLDASLSLKRRSAHGPQGSAARQAAG